MIFLLMFLRRFFMKSRKTIIVDCNYLGHASRFAIDSNLRTSKGIYTNVIYGFLETILNLCNYYVTNDLIFVWDSKESKRKELFPDYKKSRHKDLTEEERKALTEAYKQFKKLRKRILPALGFNNNFMVSGYEGDDLIADIVMNDPYGKEFLIYASDHDLYQLLSYNVSIIKKSGIYTVKDFVNEFGISPKKWWRVKVLAGCASDEVPGIKGVGEKTACKYLKNELKEKSVTYKKIVDEKEEIETKNKPLVKLPFEGLPHIELQKNKFDLEKTKEIFEYYELQSFLDNFDEWEEILK